jgi:serine/threonine-protein kinase HipA
MKHLNVFLHKELIGKLSSHNGALNFCYDEKYVEKQGSVTLSISLPLQKEPFSHQESSAFFSGLLPDDQVRKRLARYLGVSDKNTFSLLSEIGGECAGAVSLHQNEITSDLEATYQILSDTEAHEILSILHKRPMLAGEDDIRISGAGAQDKLMITFVDKKIAIPTRSTPSTHIIKTAISDLNDSVYNEFFCMKLAQTVGLPVPNVSIHWVEGIPYYLVERYDRQENDGKVIRLHQEDFCQALHIAPEMKYENEGGPTLKKCFELLDSQIKIGKMAGNNKIVLLKGVIFNFLIGNGDAHGKNFSVLYKGESITLAPFYDLMCTVVYTNQYKAKMAMKIGGEYKFKDVTIRQFEALAQNIGLRPDFVLKQCHLLANETLQKAEVVMHNLNLDKTTSSNIYKEITAIISKHYKKCVIS